MQIKIFQIDSFTNELFGGNPAAICPLDQWLPDETMQKIAAENNLSETGFFVKKNNKYHIRWFTPAVEVDLCGHATLAAGFVLFNYLGHNTDIIEFESRSGILRVKRNNNMLTLDFPIDKIVPVETPPDLSKALSKAPLETYKGISDYLLIYSNRQEIENFKPDFALISAVTARGVIVSAPGDDCDFVSRFFAPQSGVNEDPVTGSAYTTLTPYWSKRLNKNELSAIQVSKRKGHLRCKLINDRVEISGNAVIFMTGEIHI
ncbi:MAG: PhzF family phenazine biosynthesis protein [Bacteroidia bacterium]|nr:PhzF family phenazine biosynthesis protein [Bacteroidia bacterium]